MTSLMHVNIHGVYKPFKVLRPLQYSWTILADGWYTQRHTPHRYRTVIYRLEEKRKVGWRSRTDNHFSLKDQFQAIASSKTIREWDVCGEKFSKHSNLSNTSIYTYFPSIYENSFLLWGIQKANFCLVHMYPSTHSTNSLLLLLFINSEPNAKLQQLVIWGKTSYYKNHQVCRGWLKLNFICSTWPKSVSSLFHSCSFAAVHGETLLIATVAG